MDKERDACPDCERLHEDNQPCPHRIAVYFLQGRDYTILSDADYEWITKNSGLSLHEAMEDYVVRRM